MSYFVYVLLCEGDRYYTGIARDVATRYAEHMSGRGAKYTRSFRPLKIVYIQECPDRSTALVQEAAIKKMPHAQKAKLTSNTNFY